MIYVCVYIYVEKVDFVIFDKIIKISGKIEKSNIYNGLSGSI